MTEQENTTPQTVFGYLSQWETVESLKQVGNSARFLLQTETVDFHVAIFVASDYLITQAERDILSVIIHGMIQAGFHFTWDKAVARWIDAGHPRPIGQARIFRKHKGGFFVQAESGFFLPRKTLGTTVGFDFRSLQGKSRTDAKHELANKIAISLISGNLTGASIGLFSWFRHGIQELQ